MHEEKEVTTKPQSTKPPQETLLPCPFCGGNAIITDKLDENGRWSIYCRACKSGTGWTTGREKVIERWNTRISPASTAPVVNSNELISRRDAIEIANARLGDVPNRVDLEADRNLFATGYLAAAGSIKVGLQRAAAATAAPVEQSDEYTEISCAGCGRDTDTKLLLCPTCVDSRHEEAR